MHTNRYILAHDLGTTGNKASLFDARGALVSSALATYATDYPHPNWAEQQPGDWWQAVVVATQQLLRQSRYRSRPPSPHWHKRHASRGAQ